MARFPLPEPEVRLLAHAIATGLKDNPELFPLPPVEPATMESTIESYDTLRGRIAQARTEFLHLLEEKDRVLTRLKREMKQNLRYAENASGFDDTQLKCLGWSARRKKRSLAKPNQPRLLIMEYTPSAVGKTTETKGPIRLSWKPPVGGGKPAVYLVQRRIRQAAKDVKPDGRATGSPWTTIDMCYQTSFAFTPEQFIPAAEYRVLASNRAGVSRPSNSIGGG